jgi:hypothetical protein
MGSDDQATIPDSNLLFLIVTYFMTLKKICFFHYEVRIFGALCEIHVGCAVRTMVRMTHPTVLRFVSNIQVTHEFKNSCHGFAKDQ